MPNFTTTADFARTTATSSEMHVSSLSWADILGLFQDATLANDGSRFKGRHRGPQQLGNSVLRHMTRSRASLVPIDGNF